MWYHVDMPLINVCSSCYNVENLAGNNDSELDYPVEHHRMSINLYPSNRDLNIAFHHLIYKLQWTKFLIIYDTNSGKKKERNLTSQ